MTYAGTTDPLTAAEERVLFEALKTANPKQAQAIKEMIVMANLRFAVNEASRYELQFDPDDLSQVAVIGLMEAIPRFDITRGHKFITYAVWWIRLQCQNLLENKGTIKIPVSVKFQTSEIAKHRRQLQQQLSREPTIDELSSKAEMSAEEIVLNGQRNHRYLSLNMMIYEDKRMQLSEVIADDNAEDQLEACSERQYLAVIREMLQDIPARERAVLSMYYGFDGPSLTLQQIGNCMGFTRERARQLKKRGLAFVRERLDLSPAFLEGSQGAGTTSHTG